MYFTGTLISESFYFGSNYKQIFHISTFYLKQVSERSDLAFLFGDWSQSEKIPEIKPP
jgi:hypothetical protein